MQSVWIQSNSYSTWCCGSIRVQIFFETYLVYHGHSSDIFTAAHAGNGFELYFFKTAAAADTWFSKVSQRWRHRSFITREQLGGLGGLSRSRRLLSHIIWKGVKKKKRRRKKWQFNILSSLDYGLRSCQSIRCSIQVWLDSLLKNTKSCLSMSTDKALLLLEILALDWISAK